MDDFTKVLQKAVEDEAFPRRLSADPGAALREIGVEPTPEKIKALQAAKASLNAAFLAFGGQKPRN